MLAHIWHTYSLLSHNFQLSRIYTISFFLSWACTSNRHRVEIGLGQSPLGEVIHLFQLLKDGQNVVTLGVNSSATTGRSAKSSTSSSISRIHFGHYKGITHSDVIMNFLKCKITLIACSGCPPDCWGHHLQVMLEKVAGVTLISKLRAILLMEADFNCMNKWIFGFEAINKIYTLGYVDGDQCSQGRVWHRMLNWITS